MTENIIIAVITAVVTLIGGYFATGQQRKKDAADAAHATKKLKAELENDLWERLQEELEKVYAELETETKKRRELEAKIDEREKAHKKEIETLTGRIKELEKLLEKEHTHRLKVERENTRLKRENGQLKKKSGGRKI